MAVTQQQALRAVIVHEAPLARMHPQPRKWQRFFAGVYLMSFRFGSSLAALRFMLGVQLPMRPLIQATRPVNAHRKQSTEPYLSDRTATEFLIKQELLPVTNYLPDIERIKQQGVPVVIASGQWAVEKKTWYAQADQILAGKLGGEMVILPGHHGAFLDQPQEFAAALRTVLHQTSSA
jgi:pimeloyl-ACP methyl ester carboxylesterase